MGVNVVVGVGVNVVVGVGVNVVVGVGVNVVVGVGVNVEVGVGVYVGGRVMVTEAVSVPKFPSSSVTLSVTDPENSSG